MIWLFRIKCFIGWHDWDKPFLFHGRPWQEMHRCKRCNQYESCSIMTEAEIRQRLKDPHGLEKSK